jgi:6-phosphogluconolactonase
MAYRLNLEQGRLIPADEPWTEIAPGSGPRHLTFHPDGRIAYAINELSSTVTTLAYDEDHGTFEELQTISTLPDGFTGENTTADIHIAPSGRFVYGSNRGHDSIVIFGVDSESGELTCIGHESTRGATPRNFAIDPSGTYLLAANQDSDSVVTFRIDPNSGVLTPTGHICEVPTPVCIRFLAAS